VQEGTRRAQCAEFRPHATIGGRLDRSGVTPARPPTTRGSTGVPVRLPTCAPCANRTSGWTWHATASGALAAGYIGGGWLDKLGSRPSKMRFLRRRMTLPLVGHALPSFHVYCGDSPPPGLECLLRAGAPRGEARPGGVHPPGPWSDSRDLYKQTHRELDRLLLPRVRSEKQEEAFEKHVGRTCTTAGRTVQRLLGGASATSSAVTPRRASALWAPLLFSASRFSCSKSSKYFGSGEQRPADGRPPMA